MWFRTIWILILFLWAGCTAGTNLPTEEDDLVPPDGKADTGYYSSLATELEGRFYSVLELDVQDLNEEAQKDLLGYYQADTAALGQLVDSQVKLAKHQLNREKLHLNLTSENLQISEMTLDNGVLRIRYTVDADTLVTYKELKEAGLEAADLLHRQYSLKVAADPRELFVRFGMSCASGYDDGSLSDANYFYYFDPDLPGCALKLAADVMFEVRALLPPSDSYPEYDRLVEDGKVEFAIIFGAAEPGAVHGGDWGVMMWRTFEVNIRLRGFEMVEGQTIGQRYIRKRAGLTEIINLVSPYDLEAIAPNGEPFFVELLRTHEIMIYNGHSFYGSLGVLDDRENYPEDTYQILFMNSCWSYEYYTKQVFKNKVTETDSSGWELADVINNTTYAFFAQMEASTRIVVTNLLAGAESGGRDAEGRRFTWQRIIGVMNDEARGVCPEGVTGMDCRSYQPKEKHEMYGVSGVRTNTFTPSGL